jgi:hypothetical protein
MKKIKKDFSTRVDPLAIGTEIKGKGDDHLMSGLYSKKLLTNFLRTSYKLLTNFLRTSYELLTNFLQTSY